LPTMFATGIYHDMFPQYVWTITPTHGLLVALNCAHYMQSDARGEILVPT
jgi:hypothetical protein